MPDQLPAILRKAGEVVLMVWVITLPSFLIVALAPGDAALSMLRVDTVALSQSEIQAYREQMGLTDPLPVRYWHYLTGLLHGDLGTSVMTGQPVAAEIAQTLPATLLLAGSALALTFVLVILLGTVSAAFRGGWPDRAVSMFNYVAASMPTFWLGLLLIQWFAVDLDLLPASGWHQGLGLVLPTVSLAAAIVPPFIKIYRQSYGETVNKEFVRSARSRGVPFGIIRSRHVLRGSLIPVVTMMGGQPGQSAVGIGGGRGHLRSSRDGQAGRRGRHPPRLRRRPGVRAGDRSGCSGHQPARRPLLPRHQPRGAPEGRCPGMRTLLSRTRSARSARTARRNGSGSAPPLLIPAG
ncbi:MAG: ABC transporter permease, partial [Acidipropionibacterium jensenii]|nr:ABC transporter permease [Acidipropionibacterium jensenii]